MQEHSQKLSIYLGQILKHDFVLVYYKKKKKNGLSLTTMGGSDSTNHAKTICSAL